MTGNLAAFETAREALARVPHDQGLLYACCAAAGDHAEAEMIALLEQRLAILPAGSEIRLHDLHLLARLREKRGRAGAGLHPTNADTYDDLFFKFARKELAALANEATAFLQHNRTSFAAAVLLAEAYTAVGAFAQAERVFTQLRRASGGNVASVTNFDSAFHAGLPEEAYRSAARLPPVLVSRDLDPDAHRIVFTAADYAYFEKYGWGFVESFAKHNGPDVWLALHVFDMTAEERTGMNQRLQGFPNLRWSLSTEWTGLRGSEGPRAKEYYHAVRYIRFWQGLTSRQTSAWIIDTDTIFGGGVAGLFEHLHGKDLALYLAPGRFEPRNKIMALSTGASNTQAARDYLRNVAGYIGHYQQEGRLFWGIDQIALFAVLAMTGPAPPLVAGVPDWICGPVIRPGQILQPAKPI
jgi:hypothetical protein